MKAYIIIMLSYICYLLIFVIFRNKSYCTYRNLSKFAVRKNVRTFKYLTASIFFTITKNMLFQAQFVLKKKMCSVITVLEALLTKLT